MRALSIQKRSKFIKNEHAQYTLVWGARYTLGPRYLSKNTVIKLNTSITQ